MLCKNCQQETPANAAFCMHCGYKMASNCPSCGKELPTDAQFCFQCGYKLNAPVTKPAVSSNITFLAADVQESTKLISDKDVEQAREWLEQTVQIMNNSVIEFRGKIINTAGDGITAYFTGEEHGLLACFAAANIHAEIAKSNLPTRIRVGLHCAQLDLENQPSLDKTREVRIAQLVEEKAPAQGIEISTDIKKNYSDYLESDNPTNVVVPNDPLPMTSYTLTKLLPKAKQKIIEILQTAQQKTEEEQIIHDENISGERKYITSVFIKTQVSGNNPENIQKVNTMINNTIHRFEGTLIKNLGDTIFVIFGAPVSFEDHPLRACLAAYIMHENLLEARVPVDMRIGIHTGEAVIDNIGDEHHHQYDALGASVSLAARMMQTATSNQIQISSDTYQLTEKFLQTVPLGEKTIKGFAKPIDTYLITGLHRQAIRKQIDAQFFAGTPFIGRKKEIELFHRYFEQVKAGNGKLLGIQAEPGIGKTRLLFECTQIAMQQNTLVYSVSASAYEKSQRLSTLSSLLRNIFSVVPGQLNQLQLNLINNQLKSIHFTEKLASVAIISMLGGNTTDKDWLGLAPSMQEKILFTSLSEFFIEQSKETPLILAFEDMHWCDDETFEFVKFLCEKISNTHILLLLDYRPEFSLSKELKAYGEEYLLKSLSPQDSYELINSLLPGDTRLESLRQIIIKTTEGNPFFIEQYVKHLRNKGILIQDGDQFVLLKDLQIEQLPQTIQSVVNSRIDQLDKDTKQCLQQASILGRVFPLPFLRYLSNLDDEHFSQSLKNLENYDFVSCSALFPEPEYTFRHAFICDTAYHTILKKVKLGYHAKLVEQIEVNHQNDITPFFPQLAHHAFQGQQWRKALQYYTKIVPNEPSIHFLTSQYIPLGEKVQQCFAGMNEAERQQYFPEYGRIMLLHNDALMVTQNVEKYIQNTEKLVNESHQYKNKHFDQIMFYISIAQDGFFWNANEAYTREKQNIIDIDELQSTQSSEIAPIHFKLLVNAAKMHVTFPLGYYTEFNVLVDEILEKNYDFDDLSDYTTIGRIAGVFLPLYGMCMQHCANIQSMQKVMPLCEAYLSKNPPVSERKTGVLASLAIQNYCLGNIEIANNLLNDLLNVSNEIGHQLTQIFSACLLSSTSFYLNEPKAALEYANASVSSLKETNYLIFAFGIYHPIETLIYCGELEKALAILSEGEELFIKDPRKPMMAMFYWLRALTYNRMNDNNYNEKILELLGQAKQITNEIGCNFLHHKIYLAYSEFYHRIGDKKQASEQYQLAINACKEYGLTGWYDYYSSHNPYIN